LLSALAFAVTYAAVARYSRLPGKRVPHGS